jgi:dipeptidase
MVKSSLFQFLTLASLLSLSIPCTDFLLTKGSTTDSSTMITYAADSHVKYGTLWHFPAADHAAGSKRQIIEWDTYKPLGEIEEAPHTYNVVGNMNEYQVTIGESTWGGRQELWHQKGAIMDYGSLMYVALQRAQNARHAIRLIAQLVDEYGYYSEGESLSIGDPNEVWIMEIIGKADFEKGAVWVARKVPDGYVCAHANQARIRQFPLDDPDVCLYSPDVVSFAKKRGYFSKTGSPHEFSFADAYNPLTFGAARGCEGRVWSFYRQITTGMYKYLDHVEGKNLKNVLPLWVKPTNRISPKQVMNFMRDHFENSWLDFRYDVGAGPFNLPYRWRPLEWQVEGDSNSYVNERSTATQQTGWSMVAQMRSWLPREVGGLFWFEVDDADSSIYAPFYCSITQIPETWSEEFGSLTDFEFSAFWVFNMVSNLSYDRYRDIHPEIVERINLFQDEFIQSSQKLEEKMEQFYQNKKLLIEKLTSYSNTNAIKLVDDWLDFWKELVAKYLDGNRKFKNPDPQKKLPILEAPGYGEEWYRRIAEETGEHNRVPDTISSQSCLNDLENQYYL